MDHFKRVTIPLDKQHRFEPAKGLVTAWSFGGECDASRAANKEIDDLIQQGWKVVAAVPLNTTYTLNQEVIRDEKIYRDIYPQTITEGIEVLLVKS